MVQVLKHHCVAVKLREMLRTQVIKLRLPKDPWVTEEVRDYCSDKRRVLVSTIA
jgi:hypothetical protein